MRARGRGGYTDKGVGVRVRAIKKREDDRASRKHKFDQVRGEAGRVRTRLGYVVYN